MLDDKAIRRAVLKLRALRTSELALKHKFERIDFRLDVIEPEIDSIQNKVTNGVMPEFDVKGVKLLKS